MIVVIKKGNPTRQMAVCLSGTYNYEGATIRLSYQGATREFTGKRAGDALQFAFTADETAVMALGCFPIEYSVTLADGRTYSWTSSETKINVTDEDVPGEVLNINAQGALQGVLPLGDTYTDKDVKDKLNEVIKRLGCALLCALSFGLFAADAVQVQTQRKDTIPNDAQIVTGVTVDPSAFTDPGKVKEIVTNTVTKAFVEDLGISGGGGSSVEVDKSLAIKGAAAESQTVGRILSELNNEIVQARNFAAQASSKADQVNVKATNALERAEAAISSAIILDRDFSTVNGKADNAFNLANQSKDTASEALSYAAGVYQFMHANTNAWFEGTNYNVNAEQSIRKVKYSPEDWEDVAFTPCSLQLYEIRDGERKCVWDQRDWTKYYTEAKTGALKTELQTEISTVKQDYMRRGWAKYTAVNGLDNPATDTLWIDTPKVSLMAGMQWEKMIETGGTAYYTITGNGIELGAADAESTFLTIKDFEGNACLTFRKTSSYLVYCETGTDIVSNRMDEQGRVVFHFTTDVQPTGEFATVLDTAAFVEQGEANCPAVYAWTGSAGAWDCHFKAADPNAKACFARFKVKKEGENIVDYTVPVRMNGGITFEQDGRTYKIKPRVSGSTVTWSVVQ